MLIPSKNNGLILISHPTKNTLNEYFKHSVVLLFEQHLWGTIGFVINKISYTSRAKDLLPPYINQTVLIGGPFVKDKTFVIYQKNHQWQHLSSGPTVGEFLQNPVNPYFIVKGICFWSKKQLEKELKQNLWLPFNFTSELCKTPPKLRYKHLLKNIRLTEGFFSTAMGNA